MQTTKTCQRCRRPHDSTTVWHTNKGVRFYPVKGVASYPSKHGIHLACLNEEAASQVRSDVEMVSDLLQVVSYHDYRQR